MRRVISVIAAIAMVISLSAKPARALTINDNGPSSMPPNEEKIQAALMKQGVIPAGASDEEAQKIVKDYIIKKLNPAGTTNFQSPKDIANPLTKKNVEGNEKNFKGNGNSSNAKNVSGVPNAQSLPLKKTATTGKILALLVEFDSEAGPLSGQLAQPTDPDKDYWVPNFDNAHYDQMLFSKAPGANSLANYYLAQSDGLFTVEGGVYGWIKLPHPESYYGADDPVGGHDNINGPAWRIVKDAIAQAEVQGIKINYKDFDKDGDGFVDSLMVIHAGAGQEGGGGVQGNDAIWSHSWYVDSQHGGFKAPDGTMVGPYTIEPEDGAVGVFAHEYGHQLGLPDLYDTTYIGESSTGFYTLMSSGSWLGKPLGTQPANLDIWSKMVLGWTPDLTEVNAGTSGIKDFLIHSDETYATFSKGFKINLPQHPVTTNINTPFEGQTEYWSTMGDDINTSMTRTLDLNGVSNPVLNFKTWYNMEYDYDYGYVEVSTDNGVTFTKIAGNITRDVSGIPSIDGTSGTTDKTNKLTPSWVDGSFDLSAYAGSTIQVRFHYVTDGGVAFQGWAIDNITVTGTSYIDNAENPSGWTFNGFRQFAGSETVLKSHYYLGQLVRPAGTNAGLNWAYNYYGNDFERFKYESGMLLWYRDTAVADNNVGNHPGKGSLLIVDSHPAPIIRTVLKSAFNTRIQIYDAPFGLKATSPLSIHYAYRYTGNPTIFTDLVNVASQPGVPVFDDSKSYYSTSARYNSVVTPNNYGVKINVKGVSSDGSAARITVDYK